MPQPQAVILLLLNHKIRHYRCVTGIVLLLVCWACTESPGKAGSDQLFRLSLSTEPPSLDWSLATDPVAFNVIANLMVGLAQFDRQLKPAPMIAKSWEIRDGGSGNNHTRWKNSRYDQLVENAARELDANRRVVFYDEAQRILCETHLPIATLYWRTENTMLNPRFTGLEMNPMGRFDLGQVRPAEQPSAP